VQNPLEQVKFAFEIDCTVHPLIAVIFKKVFLEIVVAVLQTFATVDGVAEKDGHVENVGINIGTPGLKESEQFA
jgi:hypothetical protein